MRSSAKRRRRRWAFDTLAAFETALARHRTAVSTHFGAVFGAGEEAGAEAAAGQDATTIALLDDFHALWRDEIARDSAEAVLARAGFREPAALLGTLERVRGSPRYVQLPALSQQRFDALVPRLLAAATKHETQADAQDVFLRLLALLEAVSRRSAYLALLIEHPPLLPRLAHLMGASAWAADYLTRHPILLDELLDARVLLAEPEWNAWRAELARLLQDHEGDPERQMDALRHFQHAQTFRLLAQDLAGRLTVERLADHLSALADIIIAATLAEVWKQMRGRDAPAPHFAVIGYGKLGGKELGYASDLDLVFLYDDADEEASVRYTRLGQRLVTWLTSTTAAGALYETDLRLRPDGAAGLIVSSWRSFCRYQREHAWTWEHQALTRARYVAGDAGIGAAFEQEREAILRLPREPVKLQTEVVEMRRKLYAGHPNPTALFDLKHDAGGMVDVEFAVQYLVLAHAHEHAELTRNLGNIALLRIAGELGLLPPELAADCAEAYRHYRRRQHQLRLTGAAHARVEPAPENRRREAVLALWATVFGAELALIRLKFHFCVPPENIMSMADRDGFIWYDGKMVPWREATTHVLTHTLHYGMGVFEGVRAYKTAEGTAIFRLREHTDRLFRSAHIFGMKIPFEKDEINEAQLAVVRENKLESCYIRPLAFYGSVAMGVAAKSNPVRVAIAAWPWGAYLGAEALENGIRVKTSSFTRHHVNIHMTGAKAVANYLNSILANQEATQDGYDEALLLDPQGYVSEGSGENVFIVLNGELHTPDLSSGALRGVTRDTVFTLAKEVGIPVVERRITRDEVYCADEAFFTGTAAEVTPIRELDNRQIGAGHRGPVTARLQALFFDTVNGRNPAHREWLARVHRG